MKEPVKITLQTKDGIAKLPEDCKRVVSVNIPDNNQLFTIQDGNIIIAAAVKSVEVEYIPLDEDRLWAAVNFLNELHPGLHTYTYLTAIRKSNAEEDFQNYEVDENGITRHSTCINEITTFFKKKLHIPHE